MATNTTTLTKRRTRDDEPPYARYAFWNPYNVSLFLGGVVLGVAIDHGWISVLTCAAEVLWMIFAPDSKILRALWFERAFAVEQKLELAAHREARIGELAVDDSARLGNLCGQKQVIERLAQENPSLTVDLLTSELAKLDALLDDFIELGITARRAVQHTSTFDFPAMRRSWHQYEEQLKLRPPGDLRREVAERNLEVLRQRRARYEDLCRTIEVTRGQMDLIEQTFRLLGDEIMTMASPRELGGRIDELQLAVDAVRETADEAFAAVHVEEIEDAAADETQRRQVS